MDYPLFMRSILLLSNLVCLFVSIICFIIDSDRWHENLTSIITLIVTVWGFFVSCQINQCLLLAFTAASIFDFLVTLANTIFMIVLTVKWKKFCNGDIYFDDGSDWTCYDLNYKGYWGFVYAEITLLLLGLISRALSGVSSFFLVKFYFNDVKRDHE